MDQFRSGEQAPKAGCFRLAETGLWEDAWNLSNKTVSAGGVCPALDREKRWRVAV